MAAPIAPLKPSKLNTNSVAGQSTAATGVKLSYVVPASKVARLNWASCLVVTGTLEIVNLQVIVGGTTINITIPAAGASSTNAGNIWLNTGDTVQWNVT